MTKSGQTTCEQALHMKVARVEGDARMSLER